MAQRDDEEDRGRVRTNAAPTLHPPGLGGRGLAPPGSVGTERQPDRESDFVLGPVWLQDGDQLKGPYHMVRVDPRALIEDGRQEPHAREPAPDTKGRTVFRETGDADVDRHYQEQGQVMVPDPERRTRDAEADADAKGLRAYSMARGDVPDTDGDHSRNAHEQARDPGRDSGLSDEPDERRRGRGR